MSVGDDGDVRRQLDRRNLGLPPIARDRRVRKPQRSGVIEPGLLGEQRQAVSLDRKAGLADQSQRWTASLVEHEQRLEDQWRVVIDVWVWHGC
jgi:hypothetical protein